MARYVSNEENLVEKKFHLIIQVKVSSVKKLTRHLGFHPGSISRFLQEKVNGGGGGSLTGGSFREGEKRSGSKRCCWKPPLHR